MASLQIYRDQENAVLSRNINRAKLKDESSVLQSIHKSKQVTSISKKQFMQDTPRRVLGDVSNVTIGITSQLPGKKPVHKKLEHEGVEKQVKQSEVEHPSVEVISNVASTVEDLPIIEKMVVTQEEPDDYEDIFPKTSRLSNYLSALCAWRPSYSSFCGNADEDEDEDNEEQKLLEIEPVPCTSYQIDDDMSDISLEVVEVEEDDDDDDDIEDDEDASEDSDTDENSLFNSTGSDAMMKPYSPTDPPVDCTPMKSGNENDSFSLGDLADGGFPFQISDESAAYSPDESSPEKSSP